MRSEQLSRALRLEYLTVGWNVVEGIVAVSAATVSNSVALLAFGIDSFVESTSGAVMIWRLYSERSRKLDQNSVERVEKRAHRLIAMSLFVLGAYVALDAGWTLWRGERPSFSIVGVALTSLSLVVMIWLARAKARVARQLGSRAMQADAFQTTACWWLSLFALTGIAANGALGWWWADPAAALGIAVLIAREGRDAWRGEPDCC